MSYYKTIEGKRMDGRVLDVTHEAQSRHGDGLIVLEDAKRIFATIADDDIYTETERNTVGYILTVFNWTDEAKEWFQNQLSGFTEQGRTISMTPEEIARQHFPERDVLYTFEAQELRIHTLKAAMAETNENFDEIGLIVRLETGERVQVFSNFIEVDENYVQLRGGHIIPVKAIEKVER